MNFKSLSLLNVTDNKILRYQNDQLVSRNLNKISIDARTEQICRLQCNLKYTDTLLIGMKYTIFAFQVPSL